MHVEDQLAHARLRARQTDSGVGAAVVWTEWEGTRVWNCIVADEHEWHYIRVIATDRFVNLPPETVEDGIEGFAASFPAENRLFQVLNANPLHIDSEGEVRD